MHFCRTVGELAGEEDDFGYDELGDGAGVGEGGVEDGDAGPGGIGEVDLGGANAEAANREEVFGVREDCGR